MKKRKNQRNQSITVLRRIKSSVLSTKQLLNINGYITSGPLIQNKKLMEIRGKQFLIAISAAFLLINFIIVDQSQILSYISDELINKVDSTIDIDSFQLFCNIPNIIIPLFLGYLSDYISIGYLLMITLGVNFLSNLTLSLFIIKGDLELYLLTQILWQMANEGIQNACFNLLYEYSCITKQQTVYYSVFTIFGYCIPRTIPIISNFYLSQPNSHYKEVIMEYKDNYAYLYISLTVISSSLLLYVVRKNHNKELEEQLLDMRYYMVRLSPAQKPTLYEAIKKIILQNKPLMKQFFFSAILVGISSVLMQFKFFASVLQIKDFNYTYQPYLFSKVCQISSGLFLYPFGRRVDKSDEKFKLKIFQSCFIVISILYGLLQIMRWISNYVVILAFLIVFASLLGICYYCNFMTIMGTIYQKSGYLSRGLGFGIFSCCYNFINIISQYQLYYLSYENIFNFSLGLFIISLFFGFLFYHFQYKKFIDQGYCSNSSSYDISTPPKSEGYPSFNVQKSK